VKEKPLTRDEQRKGRNFAARVPPKIDEATKKTSRFCIS
jgi:hypothetical protein